MNLRHLRHFVMLVDRGSFVAAAEALNLTQPALSRSIRSLEQELGTILLDRRRTGTTPTPAGRLLAEEAEDILRRTRAMRDRIRAHGDGALGEIAFGFAPLPATLMLADVLAAMLSTHPGLRLSATVSAVEELTAQLRRDRLEFFVAARTMIGRADGLALDPLAALPLSLLVRTGHPLADRRSLSTDDLAGYPLACVRGDFSRGQADLEMTVQCDDYAVLMELTLGSDAVWLASSALAGKAPGRLTVLILDTGVLPDEMELVVARHAGHSPSPAARLVTGLARDLALNAVR